MTDAFLRWLHSTTPRQWAWASLLINTLAILASLAAIRVRPENSMVYGLLLGLAVTRILDTLWREWVCEWVCEWLVDRELKRWSAKWRKKQESRRL